MSASRLGGLKQVTSKLRATASADQFDVLWFVAMPRIVVHLRG
jgi:hypothetical protein